MTISRLFSLFALVFFTLSLTSCTVAGDLIKGGIWIGVLGVFFLVAIIWWLVTKMGGGSSNGPTT